jgi:predicted unusual protein kinase regulating ubiquinone biosynthesis (AarF/ABC1/UbiB family)
MFMHWLFCYVMENAFDLPILAFADTIERNLAKEINFNIEAENAEKCRIGFEKVGRTDIYVPKVYHEYNSERTLVMEWIDGIKVTHTDEIVKAGFNLRKVLYTTIEAFAE